MNISNLTFIVTDDCNFDCAYCFQEKGKKSISDSIVETAIEFFYPFFQNEALNRVSFYGGEPLLAYSQIKHAVLMLMEKNKRENKNIRFSLTTNGMLLTGEMLEFFDRYRFEITLSFDGLAQESGRKKGTIDKMIALIKQVRGFRHIDFEINSVFTPRTVVNLSGSLRFMIEPGGPDITFNLSSMEQWSPEDFHTLKNELERLVDYLALYYKKTRKIPIRNFQGSGGRQGIFRCNAGSRHMAISPEGNIWGCFLFHDYFKTRPGSPEYHDYSFGPLNRFIKDYKTRYPAVVANYLDLRQELFRTPNRFCFLCPRLESCMICPLNAAYSSGSLGHITCNHCRLSSIQMDAVQQFRHKIVR